MGSKAHSLDQALVDAAKANIQSMVTALTSTGVSDEDAINQVTDAIWAKYDADNSGQLDKDETKVFVDGLANGVTVSAEAFD